MFRLEPSEFIKGELDSDFWANRRLPFEISGEILLSLEIWSVVFATGEMDWIEADSGGFRGKLGAVAPLVKLKQVWRPLFGNLAPLSRTDFWYFCWREEKPQGFFHCAICRTGAFSSDPKGVISKKKFAFFARSPPPISKSFWQVCLANNRVCMKKLIIHAIVHVIFW